MNFLSLFTPSNPIVKDCEGYETSFLELEIYELIYCSSLDYCFGDIHLLRPQNFPKSKHFLPPDTHTYVFRKIFPMY